MIPRSQLVIHLDRLAFNIESLKKYAPSNEIIMMVKADGYGHGMEAVAQFASLQHQIKEFGCASLAEAIQLRASLNTLPAKILVFSDTQLDSEGNEKLYSERNIIPVLSNVRELKFFLKSQELKKFPLYLKFNTGMNRLGFFRDEWEEVVHLIKNSGRKSIQHVMTHMACASFSMAHHPLNISQRDQFGELKKFLRSQGLSIEESSYANSGTIEQKFGLEETHIRPGLMLYGPSSMGDDYHDLSSWKGKVVSELQSVILKTQSIKKNESIGYNSTPAPTDGLMAILGIGYGDGFSTKYNGASVQHWDCLGKIVGRINMDMTQVLFPIESSSQIKAGQLLSVWGKKNGDLEKFSEETKTIPYELFCALLPRVPRIYQVN